MGLLRYVKLAGTKLFGATDTVAAPRAMGARGRKTWSRCGASRGQVPGHVVPSGRDASAEEAETDDPMGVATVQDDLAAADKAPESKFYTVQPGDTLWKIAAAEYCPGHAGEYHRIFAANKPLLSDPDKIYPGQVLPIPPLSD